MQNVNKTSPSPQSLPNFWERARMLGHDEALLKQGMAVHSVMVADTIDHLRDICNRISWMQITPQTSRQLFGNLPPDDADKGSQFSADALLRRVNEFLYNPSYELSPEDRERIQVAFPVRIDAMSQDTYTPNAPVTRQSTSNTLTVNAGTLVLNQGIYIAAYNNVLSVGVDNIVRNGNSGNPNLGDINVLGVTGASGTAVGAGSVGGTGSNGAAGTCSSPGISGQPGGPGGTGATGGTGPQGNGGSNGLPSYQATIVITGTITGNLTILARSGTGGNGGVGGVGGTGGTGGNGGGGATCGCENTNGGNAGNGGRGGTGGLGGNGGNAVDAVGNVLLTAPAALQSQIVYLPLPAPPGSYGVGGGPGAGGAAGKVGGGGGASGCPSGNNGISGSKGGTGSQGGHGNAGTVSGKPATFVPTWV